jgi:hypothetical protein
MWARCLPDPMAAGLGALPRHVARSAARQAARFAAAGLALALLIAGSGAGDQERQGEPGARDSTS